MLPSASIADLFALDAADPVVRLDAQALWQRLLAGGLEADRLALLGVTFYPSLAGTARYLFSSKVSTLAPEDGKRVFRDIYEALTVPDADADSGWRTLAEEVGADGRQLEEVLATPGPEVADYVALARGFGHRSAHEAIGAAWGVERQLPGLWGGWRMPWPVTTAFPSQRSVTSDTKARSRPTWSGGSMTWSSGI